MPGVRFSRHGSLIRIRQTDGDGAVIEIDGSYVGELSGEVIETLTDQISPQALCGVLWHGLDLGKLLAPSSDPSASDATTGSPGEPVTPLMRLTLRIDDNRLSALPLEESLHYLPPGGARLPLIVRLSPVLPRVAQVPLSLPLRLLQLDQRGDFDLPGTVRGVFGSHTTGRGAASILQVKAGRAAQFKDWRLPQGWRTVDILHLDQVTASYRRLLATSAPSEPGTLGWLARCADLWRTRLVVIRSGAGPDKALLRRLAARLVSQGGPAVWLLDDAGPNELRRLEKFYGALIHDSPIDVGLVLAAENGEVPTGPLSHPLFDTLLLGCGRAELLRVSAPGDGFVTLAGGLRSFDPTTRDRTAGRLWSAVAGTETDIRRAAATFNRALRGIADIAEAFPAMRFDIHEGDGVVPLGRAVGRLRQATRGRRPTPTALRQPVDTGGPRFANIGLSERNASTNLTEPIPQQGARLRQDAPVILRVQLGPRDADAPVFDAVALIEEPFKWSDGQAGVWLSVGVTALDFYVAGAALQDVWLPRRGVSDFVEFTVEPTRKGISQVRVCLYYGADLLQSHRLAALVDGGQPVDGNDAAALAAALDVPVEHVGTAGWMARMEYAAAGDLADPPSRDVALSIFANDLDGRRIFTVRGAEGYEVSVAGDTSSLSRQVRAELDKSSRDQFGFYAFRERSGVPLHSGTPEQRDAAVGALAQTGWNLYSAIFSGADRTRIEAELGKAGRVIHVGHLLLDNVIPWAAIYDRPYDRNRRKDRSGAPLLRAACPAGFPNANGEFATAACGTAPTCWLSSQGREKAAAMGKGVIEESIACAHHFWGFRHIVEQPPYQADPAPPGTGGGVLANAPKRRDRTAAATPMSLLLGYNAVLGTAQAHRTRLAGLLTDLKLKGAWIDENDSDDFLTKLKDTAPDLVYLFCHARGGEADPTVSPPALELQQADGSPPTLIHASALASGLLLAHNPLVILNGCNTAAFSPDALSPFIRTLVRDCEAAGAIGTEIPVFELLAGEVAYQFLARFLVGKSAGEALLGVRHDLLARGNPMGLVYTLYAVSELAIVQ